MQSRYSNMQPAALATAVGAARNLLAVPRDHAPWKAVLVSAPDAKYAHMSMTDPDTGLLRSNIALPASAPLASTVTANMLLDLILQACLTPLPAGRSRPKQPMRPRRVQFLTTSAAASGSFSRSRAELEVVLIPRSILAQLDELLRMHALPIQICVRVTESIDDPRTAASSQPHPQTMHRDSRYSLQAEDIDDALWASGVDENDRTNWWDGGRDGRRLRGEDNQRTMKNHEMDDQQASCLRLVVQMLLMIPILNFLMVRLKLVDGPRNARVIR